MKETNYVKSAFQLPTIGLITFIVFLVLKLCNVDNPAFEWLTWFWVWFPLWFPIAVELVVFAVALILFLILDHIINR